MFTKQKAFCSVSWIGRGTLEAPWRFGLVGLGTHQATLDADVRWSTDTLMNYRRSTFVTSSLCFAQAIWMQVWFMCKVALIRGWMTFATSCWVMFELYGGWIGGGSVCLYKIIKHHTEKPTSFRHSQWGKPGMTPSSTISAKLQHWRIVVWGTPEGTLKLGQMALVPTDVPLLFMAVVDFL